VVCTFLNPALTDWLAVLIKLYNRTRSVFTQKPCVSAEQEVRCLLFYTWKKCKVSSSRNRELSQEMDLFSMMCVSLNAKLHGVLTMMSPMKHRKLFSTV